MLNTAYKIADCHCDTIVLMGEKSYDFVRCNSIGHVDLPRMEQGGISLQFFALCVAAGKRHDYLRMALEQIGRYHRILAANRDRLTVVEDVKDLEKAEQDGKIAVLLSLEGAEPLEGKQGSYWRSSISLECGPYR